MKPEKVVFVNAELEKAFNELPEQDMLKRGLVKAIRDIQQDIFCGRSVIKKLIPRELIQKYQIDNLWIYNLPSGWRLLYSITRSEEIKIIAVILDGMNHRDYEKLLNFT